MNQQKTLSEIISSAKAAHRERLTNSPDIPSPEFLCLECGEPVIADGVLCSRACGYAFRARSDTRTALGLCGVPPRYRGASESDFEGIANLFEARVKIGLGEGVFMSGTTGIGKTHAAAALLASIVSNYSCSSGFLVRWVRVPDLLMEIRATYGARSDVTESSVVGAARSHRLLILDDLGAEKMTDWSLSALYTILAGRIDDCLATIVTSNLTLRELDQWEPRIASRLASFCAIKLPAVDRRVSK